MADVDPSTVVPASLPAPTVPGEPSTHVLDIAAYIVGAAARDGLEMTVAKLHFLCYQVQAWTLASTGRPAFKQSIHAEADGVRIDEIRDAYAPLGDAIFTLQDAIDAGIVAVVDQESGNQDIQQ